MKYFILFLVTFASLNLVSSSDKPGSDFGKPGGTSPLRDAKDEARIVEIVRNNLCSFKGCWELEKVQKIEHQVVAGSLFTLTGVFEEVMEEKFYIGVVRIWEKPWEKFQEVKFEKGKKVTKW
ncbi:uncharacterized protein [Chironomus tepperi]|uniref:uncharacterized protein n=1 Tax=Chironomus tepperi TaxID=113505 RepID=UPI00391F2780